MKERGLGLEGIELSFGHDKFGKAKKMVPPIALEVLCRLPGDDSGGTIDSPSPSGVGVPGTDSTYPVSQ